MKADPRSHQVAVLLLLSVGGAAGLGCSFKESTSGANAGEGSGMDGSSSRADVPYRSGLDGGGAPQAGPCRNLSCQQTSCVLGNCLQTPCAPGTQTTVSGVVYDPAGK